MRQKTDALSERIEKLLKEDERMQAQVKRNSFFEPFDSNAYADKRTGNPVAASKLTSAGRILLGASQARSE